MPSLTIEVPRDDGQQQIVIKIYASAGDAQSLWLLDQVEADEWMEAPYQLVEDATYELEVEPQDLHLSLSSGSGELKRSANPASAHCAFLSTKSYVGRLRLDVRDAEGSIVGHAAAEVRSRKLGYRDDLRRMVEQIAERSADLLFQMRSPTNMRAAPDPAREPRLIAQQLSFLEAKLASREFGAALNRIVMRPHERLERRWEKDVAGRGIKPTATMSRALAKGALRHPVPPQHRLASKLPSIPRDLPNRQAFRTDATDENRFVRFALEGFHTFLVRAADALRTAGAEHHAALIDRAERLGRLVDVWLTSRLLARQTQIARIPFESPVLQRRPGYREIFQAWLRFNTAAQVTWEAGGEMYESGQRSVATLYEYWCYFKLLEVFESMFEVDRTSLAELFELDGHAIGLRMKVGSNTAIRGSTVIAGVRTYARLDFNRTFSYSRSEAQGSSWTRAMRPDCSLSLWKGAPEASANITHVHFDAKYKVDHLRALFGPDETAEDLEREGTVKRDDLLKMHAYKDAIRRSGGAFVLYPGERDQVWRQYEEILPGIGAFVLRPEADNPALAAFFRDVARHVAMTDDPA